MKSIFQSKYVWLMVVVPVLYFGYKLYIPEEEGNFDGFTDQQIDRMIDLVVPVVLGAGGIGARLKGDKEIYTPKYMPGHHKPEQVIMEDDDITII